MRQIAAGLFTSLDGVVESPEKWTGPYFNDQMNNTPKFVVSSTLTSADWANSTLISGDVTARVSELKQQPGGTIG